MFQLNRTASIRIHKTKIPHREWTWNHSDDGHEGVHTFEGKFVWFNHAIKTGSTTVSCKQDFEDFVREGPPNEDVPADVLVELYETIFDATDGMMK